MCFGWIDSVMKGNPGDFYYLRFTPRKPGSVWSVSNIQRVERLLAVGKMSEAGLAKVREAKANGEWEAAIRREDTSSLPEDLSQALEQNPIAKANFEKLQASQKKQDLYWLANAKTEADAPETPPADHRPGNQRQAVRLSFCQEMVIGIARLNDWCSTNGVCLTPFTRA